MIRSWGLQTLTGSAQPLFGDTLAAAFSNIKSDPNGFYLVKVAKAANYQIGDRIVLGFGGASPTNCLMVDKVNTSTNVLSCISEGNAPVSNWAINTQIVLSLPCAVIQVQLITGAGNLWLGSDSTVTNSGGGSAFAEIFTTGYFSIGQAQWNAIRTSEAWMAGPASGTVGVVAIII